jgi:hypothetical protein
MASGGDGLVVADLCGAGVWARMTETWTRKGLWIDDCYDQELLTSDNVWLCGCGSGGERVLRLARYAVARAVHGACRADFGSTPSAAPALATLATASTPPCESCSRALRPSRPRHVNSASLPAPHFAGTPSAAKPPSRDHCGTPVTSQHFSASPSLAQPWQCGSLQRPAAVLRQPPLSCFSVVAHRAGARVRGAARLHRLYSARSLA